MGNVINVFNTNATESAGRSYLAESKSELGKDAFMKILIAQLANQNPLEPMNDTDFIAQMAQFSSLENMQNIAGSMAQNNAYSMIGKYVSFINPDTLQEVAGKVSSVFMENGEPRLQVGDFVLTMKAVISVYDADFFKDRIVEETEQEELIEEDDTEMTDQVDQGDQIDQAGQTDE